MAASRTKQLSLVLLHANGRLLLGMKKAGFGAGKWNGFGGKYEPGETLMEGALREMVEESRVTVTDLSLRGRILFEFEAEGSDKLEVHVFRGSCFTGEPSETNEMRPQWYDDSAPPLAQMWPDDAFWLPLLLAGERFDAFFLFRGHGTIVTQRIRVLKPEEALPHGPDDVLVTGERQSAISA